MAEHIVDLDTWPRAAQFRFFRTYDRPHYATTVRIDVTRLMQVRKGQGVNVYRACLYAIGAGLHGVPELCMRFRGDHVVPRREGWDMAMTLEVHHALVDGAQVGAYFGAVQDALKAV